ncbi:MAG: PH domain-containing protein [Lachnospiraceae bacterium]|nr:PH domain-containing protein [Lachnospiraceae bacterium]
MELLYKERKRIWCGLPWTFTIYSFNEERLFIKTGVFNIKEDEVRLYRILDLSVTRSFGQRIFGLGTIKVDSSDKSMRAFEIKNIKHVMDVKEQLSELIEAERQRKRISGREFMSDHDDFAEDGYDEDDDN